jgi:hypothetical protein
MISFNIQHFDKPHGLSSYVKEMLICYDGVVGVG